jgi:hypothetical protein
MAQAAVRHHVEPRSISFKATVQTLEAFQPATAWLGDQNATFRTTVYHTLLDAIIVHRFADRPDRVEPRQLKRRSKSYDRLMKPRTIAKRDLLKGVPEN